MQLEQDIYFILTRLQLSVQQIYKTAVVSFGITPAQYGALYCLWDEDGQPPSQIGIRLGLDSSSITGILDRLEQKGLVERQHSVMDRRGIKVMLTDKASQLKEPVQQAMAIAYQKALSYLDPEEIVMLKKLLRKMEGKGY